MHQQLCEYVQFLNVCLISPVIGTSPNGRNGVIVEPGKKEHIWNALKHYLDNPKYIIVEGKESLEIVKPYTPDYVLNHLKKIYEELS